MQAAHILWLEETFLPDEPPHLHEQQIHNLSGLSGKALPVLPSALCQHLYLDYECKLFHLPLRRTPAKNDHFIVMVDKLPGS